MVVFAIIHVHLLKGAVSSTGLLELMHALSLHGKWEEPYGFIDHEAKTCHPADVRHPSPLPKALASMYPAVGCPFGEGAVRLMNAAMLLVRCLEHEGVRFIFGVPGEETLNSPMPCWMRGPGRRHQARTGRGVHGGCYGRLSGEAGVFFDVGAGRDQSLDGRRQPYLDHAPSVTITGKPP